jgi:parallel beta-helix repeat protein
MVRAVMMFIGTLAAGLTVALADEGRIPVFQATTISQAGSYFLTNDIDASGSASAVTIAASDVILDLNGHAILDSASTSTANLIWIQSGMDNITVRNGFLRGGAVGVYYSNTGPNGFVSIHIQRVTSTLAGQYGIFLEGPFDVEVTSCRVVDPGVAGIQVQGVVRGFTGRIEDNIVRGSGGTGILLKGLRGGEVRNNTIDSFGTTAANSAGILLTAPVIDWGATGNVVDGNTILDSGDGNFGLDIEQNCPGTLITGNTVSGNGNAGIFVQSDGNRIVSNVVGARAGSGINVTSMMNVIERNHTTANFLNGISIGGSYNLIDSNVSEGNQGAGLSFGGSALNNAYRNNMLRSNAGGAVKGSSTDAGGNVS